MDCVSPHATDGQLQLILVLIIHYSNYYIGCTTNTSVMLRKWLIMIYFSSHYNNYYRNGQLWLITFLIIHYSICSICCIINTSVMLRKWLIVTYLILIIHYNNYYIGCIIDTSSYSHWFGIKPEGIMFQPILSISNQLYC